MKNIDIEIVEKAKSEYLVHLNAQAQHGFALDFDLTKMQELKDLLKGIGQSAVDPEFAAGLKKYGNRLYDLLFGADAGEEFKKLRSDGFCMRLRLPENLEPLPWEYLADEEGFLFKGRKNCLVRVPSLEERAIPTQRISPPVKVFEEMGRILDVQKNHKEALRSYLFAHLVEQYIIKLRDEIGEELFNKYFEEIQNEQRESGN